MIGKGKLSGKGVYANRDFAEGEVVMAYKLKELSQKDFDALPASEHKFTHSYWGKIYLYPPPARYVNHSADPNTRQDLKKMCDYATRLIKKGEMITTNATLEVETELKTFAAAYENNPIKDFKWLMGGYRNAEISYTTLAGLKRNLRLKRVKGNWTVLPK